MNKFIKKGIALTSMVVMITSNMPMLMLNVRADEKSNTYEAVQDSNMHESWGTCDVTFSEGVLTIGEGTAGEKDFIRNYVKKYNLVIKEVIITGTVQCNDEGTSFINMFLGLNNLQEIKGLKNIDTSKATSFDNMFGHCTNIKKLDLSSFDTSKVTTMNDMFMACNELTEVNVSGFNTRNVESMSRMFAYCYKLTTLDLSCFVTENLKNVYGMFLRCEQLETLKIKNFNIGMGLSRSQASMFNCCWNLKNIDTGEINIFFASEIDDVVFRNCYSLRKVDLSGFDFSHACGMPQIFYGCEFTDVITPSSFSVEDADKYAYLLDAMKAGRWKDVTAGIEYDDVPEKLETDHKYVYLNPVGELKLNNSILQIVKDTNTSSYNNIWLTSKASGGDGDYYYKWSMYSSETKKVTDITDMERARNAQFRWKNSDNFGTMTFYVDVTDGTGKTVRSNSITIDDKGNVIENSNISDIIKNNNLNYQIKTESDSTQLLTGIKPDTEAAQMKQNFGGNIVIKNVEGKEISDTEKMATGYTIEVVQNGVVTDTVTVVIKGDTDGNSAIDVLDMETIQKSILGIGDKLSGAYKEAATLTEGSGDITVLDMEAIQKDILGIQKIN